MIEKTEPFDFTSIIETVRPWMESSHPDFYNLGDTSQQDIFSKRHEFSQALFAGLPEFLCMYLNYPIDQSVIDKMSIVPQRPKDVLIQQSVFPQEHERFSLRNKGAWREGKTFCLTLHETRAALDVANGDKALALSVSILGDAVIGYAQLLFEQIGRYKRIDTGSKHRYARFGRGNGSQSFLNDINSQTGDASQFLQEFLPIFAHGFVDIPDIKEKDFALGLCTLFRNKAMQSIAYDKSLQICPFSSALSALARVTFKEDEQGSVTISNEQRPGALFYFLYQKAEKILAEQEASLELASQQMAVDHS